jgi:hypothetical protein
MNLDTVKS